MKKNRIIWKILIVAILASASILCGCLEEEKENGSKNWFFYSFEKGMDEWKTDGTDLDEPQIDWGIERTTNLSYSGDYAITLYLDNMNDAGKIWLEKSFNLSENSQYEVNISYNFATRDYGDVNLFKILTGTTTQNPESYNDLTVQETTGHDQGSEQGYIWLNKTYKSTIQTDESGRIFIHIGVWGTWETYRQYFIDNVNISFNEVKVENIPDIGGSWNLSYYNWDNNVTKTDEVQINVDGFKVTISNDTELMCNATILKNNLPAPNDVSPYIIQGCDFDGLGIDVIYIHNSSYMKTELPMCENCNPAILEKNN